MECATMRATVSVGPGENGTTMVIALLGNSSAAKVGAASDSPAAKPAARARALPEKRLDLLFVMLACLYGFKRAGMLASRNCETATRCETVRQIRVKLHPGNNSMRKQKR